MTNTNLPSVDPQTANRQIALKVASLVLLAIVVRFVPLLHPLEVLDSRTMSDDSYLSLEVAKNIGQGAGPLYGRNYTNGFQPLQVLLVSAVYSGVEENELAGIEILDRKAKQALAVIAIFDLGTLLLLSLLLSTYYGWTTPTFLGLFVWAAHPAVVGAALNGLETSLSVFSFVLVLYLFNRARACDKLWPRSALGLALGLAVLSRIDMFLAGACILALELYDLAKGQWRFSEACRGLLLTFAGFLVVYLPWVFWSWRYTGLFYPISGVSVRFQSLAYIDHQLAAWVWVVSILLGLFSLSGVFVPTFGAPALYGLSGVIVVMTLWQLVVRGQRHHPESRAYLLWQEFCRWPLLWLFSLTLFFAYTLYVFTWWYHYRYFFVIILLPVLILTAFAKVYLQAATHRPIAQKVAILVVVAICFVRPGYWALMSGSPAANMGYRGIGVWAAQNIPPGTVVGAVQSGALGYFAQQLDVVNVDGVVDRDALAAMLEGRMLEFMRERGVKYYIGWANNNELIWQNSQNPLGLKLIRELDIRSWRQRWFFFEVVPPEIHSHRQFAPPTGERPPDVDAGSAAERE